MSGADQTSECPFESVVERPKLAVHCPDAVRRSRYDAIPPRRVLFSLPSTKNSFDVVAVRLEHESGVVTGRKAMLSLTVAGCAVVGAASFQGCLVERVYLGAIPRYKGSVLFHAMRVKAVNPENRVVNAVADTIGPTVVRHLHHAAHAKRAQSGVVKRGGTTDVRDSNSGVIDHRSTLSVPLEQ